MYLLSEHLNDIYLEPFEHFVSFLFCTSRPLALDQLDYNTSRGSNCSTDMFIGQHGVAFHVLNGYFMLSPCEYELTVR